jgi:hypothetical protein
MALTVEQFRKILRADDRKLKSGLAPAGLDVCHQCRIPLQESKTGNRPVMVGKRLKHFCSDCYFDRMGREIDDHPIFMPRVRRG